MKKRILKNILKIWHLPKGDLPKINIIRQPSDKPARGLWYIIEFKTKVCRLAYIDFTVLYFRLLEKVEVVGRLT
jgi:hypothetical protein